MVSIPSAHLAMHQNPNRTPSGYITTTKIGPKLGGDFTDQNGIPFNGFDHSPFLAPKFLGSQNSLASPWKMSRNSASFGSLRGQMRCAEKTPQLATEKSTGRGGHKRNRRFVRHHMRNKQYTGNREGKKRDR